MSYGQENVVLSLIFFTHDELWAMENTGNTMG